MIDLMGMPTELDLEPDADSRSPPSTLESLQ